MYDWQPIYADGTPVEGWEAWNIQVHLATLADGRVVPIGLRIEPRDDWDGKLADQHLTRQLLHDFPLGFITDQAKADALPEATWERVDAIRDATLAKHDQQIADIEAMREEGHALIQEAVAQVYADAGMNDREVRLQLAADTYLAAQRQPDIPPRQYVADALGVSLTTVDRLLRAARQEGFLDPYHGSQGKHGKKIKPIPMKKIHNPKEKK